MTDGSSRDERENALARAQPSREAANRRWAWIMTLVVAGFFGVAFVQVPLYNTFCKLTGLNGGSGVSAAPAASEDKARWVMVDFTSTVIPGLPWGFEPTQRRVRVHPGETKIVFYRATNFGGHAFTGQAAMSVMPEVAATHFEKIECFCFKRQTLQPKETREFPLVFFLTPDLPHDVHSITLSYVFFPIDRPTP